MSSMRWSALIAALALCGAVPAAVPTATAAPNSGGVVSLLSGSTPTTTVFPNNAFTVHDRHQLTGRRVSLPVPQCTSATRSVCDAARIINQLDGFDLQPRVSLPFSGPISVASITLATVSINGPDGPVGLGQLVWDPSANTLAGIATDLLREDTVYTIVVTDGVLDASGAPVNVCGPGCHARRTKFVTESATTELDGIRKSLDSGAAYRQAGITDRSPQFVQNGTRDVFPGPSVLEIQRNDQVNADPTKPLVTSMVPDLAQSGVGQVAFGSFLSPQFVTNDAVIPRVPTGRTPPALGAARLGFALIVPAGTPPAGGWPVAVYGPGFTRSHYDLFVTSDFNAAAGIATLATDPLGHDFGPFSTTTVTTAPATTTTFLSYGRGHDLDGDGMIANNEGVSPTDHKTYRNGRLVNDTPSPNALVGLRDGLIQTAADNMALVRAIEGGVDVNGDGSTVLSRTNVMYYGLSFGGIYGTMLLGTDTHVRVGFLNSGGGPIADIARLSGFRSLLAQQFAVSRPSLLNGGPGLNGFTESLPEPQDPPMTQPYPGSVVIQQYLADANWAERSGSPDPFAPLIRLRPRYPLTKHVEWQTAFGDHTVPNVTAGNIYRAGHVFDLVTYYRNDKTGSNGSDPHGFLADPTLDGNQGAEQQLTAFLQSGGTTVIDPDGAGPVFEVPIASPGNLDCLHYAEPQTGMGAFPPAASGECP